MKWMRLVLFVMAVLCAGVMLAQQAKPLTDEEVQAAIATGSSGKRGELGLSLQDQLGGCSTCATTGFTVHLYTAEQWIEMKARRAKMKLDPSPLQM